MPRKPVPSSIPHYSAGEELAHGVTHGIGLVLSIAGLALLVVLASLRGDARDVVACSIFGATLVLLYGSSTLYHGLSSPRAKRVLQVTDHLAIYLLIAGTYTPFTLISLRGGWGWTLFGLAWGLALAGIVQELWLRRRIRFVSTLLYLGLGWLVVIAAKPLFAALAPGGLVLLLAGGLAYTLGVVFYALDRRYHHAIWHVFVLAGSVCHYFAVLNYVVPRGAMG